MKIRVNRNKLGRGNLFREDGQHCILGHTYHKLRRKSDKFIVNTVPKNGKNTTWKRIYDYLEKKLPNTGCDPIYSANDSFFLTREQREHKLIYLFKKNGYELEFYG